MVQAHPGCGDRGAMKRHWEPDAADAVEEHEGYPDIELVPRHEIVRKGMKKHFSHYLWRKILENKGSGTRGP